LPTILGIVFALCLGSAVPLRWATAQALLPIRIGYQPGAEWLLYAARDLKLFEKAGLSPEFVEFTSGPPMIAAMESHSIDVGNPGIVPFLLGLSEGLDWQLIGLKEGAYSEGIVARRDSDIETPADLKGKRIGYVRGSSAACGIAMALRQHGIRRDQVTLLDMPPAEQLAALARKEIDAAVAWEPWIQRMIHDADSRLIAREGELGIYISVSGYAVRREWLRDNRETAVRFLRALLMAREVLRKDESVAISAGARAMGISEPWAETIYQDSPPPNLQFWADPRYPYSLAKGSPLDRRLRYLAAFLLEEKIIASPVDLRGAMDASVISDALKMPSGGR
jgi:aliphatic sulfonates family ABC transporter substrate-binding protein